MKEKLNNSLSTLKNLKTVLFMLLITIIVSCSNENENIESIPSQEISSIQHFKSKAAFESKMSSIAVANDTHILSEILNEDNIVSIGEYLIKIDENTASVYTLKSALLNQYNDLANINLENKNITKLSIYEDVLSVLDGSIIAAKSACSTTPASYDYDSETVHGNYRSLTITGSYKAYGIYFMLTYGCTPSDGGYSRLDDWDITYQTRNCVYYSSYGENDYGDGENEGSWNGTPYLSTSPLVSFHCHITCSSSAGIVKIILES